MCILKHLGKNKIFLIIFTLLYGPLHLTQSVTAKIELPYQNYCAVINRCHPDSDVLNILYSPLSLQSTEIFLREIKL